MFLSCVKEQEPVKHLAITDQTHRHSPSWGIMAEYPRYEYQKPEKSYQDEHYYEHSYYEQPAPPVQPAMRRRPAPSEGHNPWDLMAAFSRKASYGHGGKCCPHVVDSRAFFGLLAAIPLVTFFLNMQIQANIMAPGKRKRRRKKRDLISMDKIQDLYNSTAEEWFQEGNSSFFMSNFPFQ